MLGCKCDVRESFACSCAQYNACIWQEHLDDGTIMLNVLQILGVDGSQGTSIFADPIPQISEVEQVG